MGLGFTLSVTIRMPEIVGVIRELITVVSANTEKESDMSAALDALKVQVKANNDLVDSARMLIHGLADQIAALKDDPVALQQLVDDLKAHDDPLAADVAANTPAADPPVDPPVVDTP